MRPQGKTKLGFFPLPVPEAARVKKWVNFPEEFSALDPCVGDGVAFTHLLEGAQARRYGIEIDANRAEEAARLGKSYKAGAAAFVGAHAYTRTYLLAPLIFQTRFAP
jgi:hypothetical protein